MDFFFYFSATLLKYLLISKLLLCNLSLPMTVIICYLVIVLLKVLHLSAGVHLFSPGARLLEVQ